MSRNGPSGRSQRMRADEKGVSAVLGAVLMFGLLVAALAMIQVQFVPVWQAQKEANLSTTVSNQLAQLNADMGRQVGNASAAGISDPLTLAAPGFTFFSGNTDPGTVSFTPVADGITVSSNQLTIQQQGDVQYYGLGETWTPIAGGTITDIDNVLHLRLRIDMGPAYDDGDTATLTITDADGDFAGKAVVTFLEFPSEDALEVRTYNAANNELSSDAEAYFQQAAFNFIYFDLLDSTLLFRDVIAASEPPFSITVSDVGLLADYTIVYDTSQGGGSRVGGGGIVVDDYERSSPGGYLRVTRPNRELPQQTYTLEYGAILLDQADGSAMVVPPPFDVSVSGTQVLVTWSVPGPSGQANAISGSSQVNVNLSPVGTGNSVSGVAPRLTFTLVTEHPSLWAAFWDGRMVDASLTGNVAVQGAPCSAAQFHYTVCTTSGTATLNVYGSDMDPNSTLDDLFLTFKETDVNVELRASG